MKTNIQAIEKMAIELTALAERCGVVLTITQQPLKPLAMGSHRTVVEVRPQRILASVEAKQ